MKVTRGRERAGVCRAGKAALFEVRSAAMRTRRAGALALGCALATAACQRTPEEFARPASSASTMGAVTSSPRPALQPPAPQATEARAETPPAAHSPPPKTCPSDPEPSATPLPVATLRILDADSAPVTVEAEIAKGEHDTTRGLMYRTSMPETHGMLFELERADHAFWMHNTCISLDLVYIEAGQIVGIIDSAPVLNDEPRTVSKLSSQVLELNAGFCKRHGVRVGQHVALPGKSN